MSIEAKFIAACLLAVSSNFGCARTALPAELPNPNSLSGKFVQTDNIDVEIEISDCDTTKSAACLPDVVAHDRTPAAMRDESDVPVVHLKALQVERNDALISASSPVQTSLFRGKNLLQLSPHRIFLLVQSADKSNTEVFVRHPYFRAELEPQKSACLPVTGVFPSNLPSGFFFGDLFFFADGSLETIYQTDNLALGKWSRDKTSLKWTYSFRDVERCIYSCAEGMASGKTGHTDPACSDCATLAGFSTVSCEMHAAQPPKKLQVACKYPESLPNEETCEGCENQPKESQPNCIEALPAGATPLVQAKSR